MVKIAIIGFGVVGSGVYEVIRTNASEIECAAGQKIDIKYILDIRDFSDHPESNLFTNDVNVIADDDEVSIVVETMGGLEPANTFSRLMLSKGKTVITSNKELVANYGDELFKLAEQNGCAYYFEASVGGGIPIIRPLESSLSVNKIKSVSGILNGTTHYILTRMFRDEVSFEDALKEAQQKGYAERDPSADVDGLDTGKKISILASIIKGKKVNFKDVPTEGIRDISVFDTEFAEKLGYSVKLIGCYRHLGDSDIAFVAPMLVDKDYPLYAVSGVFNGIVVRGNMLGTSMFYGRGAGKLPTASAVVSDIVFAAKNSDAEFKAPWKSSDGSDLADVNEVAMKAYVRLQGNNPDLKTVLEKAFGTDINLIVSGDQAAFITQPDTLNNIKSKLDSIDVNVSKILNILE